MDQLASRTKELYHSATTQIISQVGHTHIAQQWEGQNNINFSFSYCRNSKLVWHAFRITSSTISFTCIFLLLQPAFNEFCRFLICFTILGLVEEGEGTQATGGKQSNVEFQPGRRLQKVVWSGMVRGSLQPSQ